jgi:hypothetical protein
MTNRQRLSLIFLFSLTIIALILLATALPQLNFQSGEPFPIGSLLLQNIGQSPEVGPPTSGSGAPLSVVAKIIIWVVIPLSIVYALISPEGRRQLLRLLPFVLGVLLIVYVIRQLPKQERAQEVDGALGNLAGPEVALPTPPAFVADPPQWLLISVNFLLGLIIVGAIWLVWRRLRLHRTPETPQVLIIQEAERALIDLQAGKDLKNTIIRCYAEMSRVLSEAQRVKRRRAMTPREFELQLAAMGLNDDHIRQLTRLFEGVRYGSKAPTGRQEREAVDCLRAIVRAYGKAS